MILSLLSVMPILTNTNQIIFPLLYTFVSININMGISFRQPTTRNSIMS